MDDYPQPLNTLSYTFIFGFVLFTLFLTMDLMLRIYEVGNNYDNVQYFKEDLIEYAKAHNGFNNPVSDDASYNLQSFIEGKLEQYNLTDIIDPMTDLQTETFGYVQRTDEIFISITYTKYSVIPFTPKPGVHDANRKTATTTFTGNASGHIKDPGSATNYELKEERTYREAW